MDRFLLVHFTTCLIHTHTSAFFSPSNCFFIKHSHSDEHQEKFWVQYLIQEYSGATLPPKPQPPWEGSETCCYVWFGNVKIFIVTHQVSPWTSLERELERQC